GLGHLTAAGVPRDALIAFRAGNYGASNETWNAMRQVGLAVDSSYNLSYLGRHCMIRWPEPAADLFEAQPGVWELPITNFTERTGYRHLEITAISAAEMIRALRMLRRAGVQHVTVVAHPAEFFFIDSIAPARGRPNRINIGRFRRLLRFLAAHRDEFIVRTVGDLGRALQSGSIAAPSAPPEIPRGSAILRALRLPVQAAKRIDARFGRI
ncbi:MAG: polysaccharide deacetylase family protein, partial [Gemmatimonadales bacterium]